MSLAHRWRLPCGREALELPGSTADVLRVGVIRPDWQWIEPPIEVPREGCQLLPSRYLHGQVPDEA